MKVIAFLARRLLTAIVVVFFVITLTFVVNRAIPSDPARMVAGPQARPADVTRIRQQLGLTDPIVVQYGKFLKRLVHFGPSAIDAKTPQHETCGHIGYLHVDLGRSYQQRMPVVQIIKKRLPYTALLAVAATFISALLGVAAGTLAAMRRNTWIDGLTVAGTLIGISAPTFLLGVLLQYTFAHQLGLLPINGAGEGVFGLLQHIILPAMTLGLFGAASYTRLTRSELIETLRQDYVRTARAKGVSEYRAVLVHALRNALVAITTVIGLDLGGLLGGAVITEQIFSWPGIGSLAVRAMVDRDGPVIMGTVLVGAVAIVAASLFVDAIYALLDPRIRR